MKQGVLGFCLIVIMLWPDLSLGQAPVDASIPGFYYCRFSAHTGSGIFRLVLGSNGTITSASGRLRSRRHFCFYTSMSHGQYSSIGQDLEALIVMGGAAGRMCPFELRAPQVMISIQTAAGGARLDSPVGQIAGQCYHVHGFND